MNLTVKIAYVLLKNRLELFHAVVTPVVLYGLSTFPPAHIQFTDNHAVPYKYKSVGLPGVSASSTGGRRFWTDYGKLSSQWSSPPNGWRQRVQFVLLRESIGPPMLMCRLALRAHAAIRSALRVAYVSRSRSIIAVRDKNWTNWTASALQRPATSIARTTRRHLGARMSSG